MPNVKSIISRHNKRILSSNTVRTTTDNCNCRKPDECPLKRNCLHRNIVYEAEATGDDGEMKKYIGMTANTFKERFYNHKKSFTNDKYEKETELSKHVWNLMKSNKQYSISWSIINRRSTEQHGLLLGMPHTLDTFHVSGNSRRAKESLNICVSGLAKHFGTAS